MQTLGIIGCGAFTKFMLPYLQPHFKISVWNRSGIKAGTLPEGIADVPIAEAAACEIVALSVPIPAFIQILPQIAEYIQPGALVMDVASVKVRPVELMLEYLPPHCEIISTHPLFGPESGKDGLAGLRVAVAEVRTERTQCVVDFFAKQLG
ncbi:MAG: prephenate dehydrogenase, partial [Planctomycetes bacterium]|nr:prephenate dehydrogenase [Planctomycetota bacterium]